VIPTADGKCTTPGNSQQIARRHGYRGSLISPEAAVSAASNANHAHGFWCGPGAAAEKYPDIADSFVPPTPNLRSNTILSRPTLLRNQQTPRIHGGRSKGRNGLAVAGDSQSRRSWSGQSQAAAAHW
jgi:hypothetical protein